MQFKSFKYQVHKTQVSLSLKLYSYNLELSFNVLFLKSKEIQEQFATQ